MPTKTKVNPIEKALQAVKPFAIREKKFMTHPVLAAALVTPDFVIATDAYRAVRIRHGEQIKESYLHFYKKDSRLMGAYEAKNYPNICNDHIFRDPAGAQEKFEIDVIEWLEAHKVGSLAAKEHPNKNITLVGDILKVEPADAEPFNQITYSYKFNQKTPIERVTYNCKYMLDALRLFKKYKHQKIIFHFFGDMLPILLTAGNIEIVILPIRTKK